MRISTRHLVVLAALAASGGVMAQQQASSPPPAAPPGSQTAQASGTHKHYADVTELHRQAAPSGQLAPRLQNLGTHAFPVSTTNRQAQLFTNQGLNLAYAFNHAESARAFREAARLDPNLAMAFWGQALVLGPNINAAMEPNEEPNALALVQKAVALKAKATQREQALIDALALRYTGNASDRVARDAAYAAAMRKVHEAYPNDLDITTLYVESVMDLRPWGYWTGDGKPYDRVAEAVALTEGVLARNPKHPGALHLYIHLMEANEPWKAEKAADALLPLMPAAGHIVHMPSHIFQRVGRYADAMKSNQLAIAADEDYITQCRAQGLYPIGYYPHNLHFLWFASTFDGQGKIAVDTARKTASKVDPAVLKQLPLLAAFKVVPYYALTRFGRWDEMLAEPAPSNENAFLFGIYHYNRGIALVAKGRLDEAAQELATVKRTLEDKALDQPLFSPNTGRAVLTIAPEVLAGEIAAARKQYDVAIAHLDRAVRLEDGLVYTEPSEWHYPPRHTLGAVLLEAGRPAEAETVYWQDLRRNPENGWALFGVVQALKAQKKDDKAALAEARFKKAWARADVTLTASRLMR
jgi:tetratricopeptide (TPR) repeat protein